MQTDFKTFLDRNLWRVDHEARYVLRGSADTDWRYPEMQAVGRVALWRAFQRYGDKPLKGKLLHRVIRLGMFDELRRLSEIPREYFAGLREVRLKQDELSQRFGREVSEGEALLHLDWPSTLVRRYKAARDAVRVSVDAGDENVDAEVRKLDDGSHASLFEELDRSDKLLAVASAVETLPKPLRHAIVACVFEGKTYREHAKEEGVTYQAIQLRIVRARKMLRMKLQDLRTENKLLK